MTKQSLKGNLMFMLAMEIILGSYNWSLVSGIAVIPPRQCATTEDEDLRRGGGIKVNNKNNRPDGSYIVLVRCYGINAVVKLKS